jgi:very-short-patch-repair endonuclease
MDSQAQALLTAQGGVVASDQLAGLGLTATEIRGYVRSGRLVRVRRGAHVDGEAWRDADTDARYRLTVQAVMRSRSRWADVATHQSALALHQLPLWHVDRRLVVLSGDVQETTTTSGLRVAPLRALAAVTHVRGLRTMAVADAVVTMSSRCVEAGVVAGDAALHSGLCTPQDVAESLERLRPGLRGRARLARAVALLDPLAESPGESRTRLVLTALGLPVRSQVPICDELGELVGRVDFLVAEKVVLEFDGAVKYGGTEGAAALVEEKRREDRLRELGYEVIRVTWDELADPERLLARILAALRRQGL